MPELVPLILSPTLDFVFKRLFGDSKHIIHLIRFLQSTLSLPAEEYEDVAILDPHINRTHAGDKLCVLDVLIRTRSGRAVNVEVQVGSVTGMWERMQFYGAKLLAEQIGKGDDDYAGMPQVIQISILTERLIREGGRYHHRFRLYDVEAGLAYPNSLEIHTLELSKLPAVSDGTRLWEWLRFLASETPEEFAVVKERGPEMAEAVVRLMELSADDEMRMLAAAAEKARRDKMARERYVREEAEAEGEARGEMKGRTDVARQLLRMKMPLPDIAEATGLPEADVQRLAGEDRS